jgi:sterol desaturase/sphingolipid hydroxylase (fatty acid hydroxylase superfamily)
MTHEVAIRMVLFFGIFIVMAVWELSAPRRALTTSKTMRWFSNLAMIFLNTVMLRMISLMATTTAPVGMALLARDRGWGLLNNWALPEWLTVALPIVALDFVIYLQHVLSRITQRLSSNCHEVTIALEFRKRYWLLEHHISSALSFVCSFSPIKPEVNS